MASPESPRNNWSCTLKTLSKSHAKVCNCTPNRRSLAIATQPFPPMATTEPPLYSVICEHGNKPCEQGESLPRARIKTETMNEGSVKQKREGPRKQLKESSERWWLLNDKARYWQSYLQTWLRHWRPRGIHKWKTEVMSLSRVSPLKRLLESEF